MARSEIQISDLFMSLTTFSDEKKIILGIPEHFMLASSQNVLLTVSRCTRKIVEEYKVGLYDLYKYINNILLCQLILSHVHK